MGMFNSSSRKSSSSVQNTTENVQAAQDNAVVYGAGSTISMTDPGIIDFLKSSQIMMGQNFATSLGMVEKNSEQVGSAYENAALGGSMPILMTIGGGVLAFLAFKTFKG